MIKIIKSKETEIYNITLGLIKGYKPEDNIDRTPFGNIINKSNPEDKKSNLEKKDIIERISKRLDETEDKTGIYLSLKITESNILYKREWGCPPLGEPVIDISITRNPKFNTDNEKFKYAVKTLTQLLKEEFKQSTVTMTVSSGIIYYYD